MESVVEGLRVEEDAEAIGLADLSTLGHVPVVLTKDFFPIGHLI